MKKLVTAFTACMIAGLVSAQVQSQNVVGYYAVTIPAQQYTILGLSFDQVGAVDQGIPVNGTGALIPDPIGAGFAAGGNVGAADNLQFWTGTGYLNLYLFDTTSTAAALVTRKNKWMNPAGLTSAQTPIWGASGQPSLYKVTPGEAFWLKRKTGSYASPIANVNFSGQVVTGSQSRVINEGYNLIAGSHTTAFVPNPDIAGTGSAIDWKTMGAFGGGNVGAADNMQFWTGTGYLNLYLFDTTSTAAALVTRKNKWMNPAGLTSAQTVDWGASGQPSKYQSPLGQGFWYKRYTGKGTFNLTETQPYTLN